MQTPSTVAALMELVHSPNWIRTAIPGYPEIVSPLQNLLEENYTLHKIRKKSLIINRPISAWGEEHQDAFTCLITAIKNQATLATTHP